jgi:hypothetical protein
MNEVRHPDREAAAFVTDHLEPWPRGDCEIVNPHSPAPNQQAMIEAR